MSALSTIEAGFDQVTVVPKARRRSSGLHLVTNSGPATSVSPRAPGTGAGVPSASPGLRPATGPRPASRPRPAAGSRPAADRRARPQRPEVDLYSWEARLCSPEAQSRRPGVQLGGRGAELRRQEVRPLRLTRRGRLVVGVFAVVLATVALSIAAMAAAGRAQASNHGRDGAGYQGMHQIVVEPGETLWTIASRAEPTADPRQVISEIMTANSMTSTVVQAGELLWVPK
jgi:hypothetical protein